MRLNVAYRHPVLSAAVAAALLTPTLIVVGLSILGHELGLAPIAVIVDGWLAWVDRVRAIDLTLVVLPSVAFLVAVLPLLDLELDRTDRVRSIGLRVRLITPNLVVSALALLVGAALVSHVVVESVLRLGA